MIRLDPANGQAYRWRAQAYALSANQAKADSDYDRAGELTAPVPTEKPVGPALVKAMSFRMGNYESEADCDQAIRDITEAPAWVRENNPPAFHNRGYAFYQKGEYARAAEDFSAAIPLCRPGDAYIPLRMRGMAYLRLGNTESPSRTSPRSWGSNQAMHTLTPAAALSSMN